MTHATIAAPKKTRDELAGPAPGGGDRAKPAAQSEWRRLALICMLLIVGGAVRYWWGWPYESIARKSAVSPFPLSEFPQVLGQWQKDAGSEITLDADIARIAGAIDYLEWTYVDKTSGEKATVMVLYGLGKLVWPHVPDVCYPAHGFKQEGSPKDFDLPIPGTTTKARFRVQTFAMSPSGQSNRLRLEVYHSLRNAGEWGLDMFNWKLFRPHPGMFKVMVQRQAPGTGENREDDPIKELLGLIVREIDERAPEKR